MGETNSIRSNSSKRAAMESLSLEINRYPRDLLTRFMSSNACTTLKDDNFEEEVDEEAVELSLGLSLGGRFGVDKTSNRKLTRSSSIAGSIPFLSQHQLSSNETPPPVEYPLLTRTSSLPTETQEEWRKRKEIQSLRRLEAKRRRCEKQRNLKGEVSLEDVDLSRGNWVASSWGRPGGVGVNVSKGCSFHGFMSGTGYGGDGGSSRSGGHRQGSQESQGGGSSSGVSEFESKQIQGSVSGGETRSSSSFQSLQDRTNQDSVGSSGTKPTENTPRNSRPKMENPSKKLVSAKSSEKEVGTKSLEDMPCVFTIGDGPNGRKVEGILYKYGRGEEARIMCICHGSFLSPAEFVKHAGGGDVAHPLRRIVVNPLGVPFL